MSRPPEFQPAEGRLRESNISWSKRPRVQNRCSYAVDAASASESNGPSKADSVASNLVALEAASLGLTTQEEHDLSLFVTPLAATVQNKLNGPPDGYSFPRNDSVVSRKLPPSPCKVCGSDKHWDCECPNWVEFLVSRAKRAFAAGKDVSPDKDREYAQAYVNYVSSKNGDPLNTLSSPVQGGSRDPLRTSSRSFKVSMVDIPDAEPLRWSLPSDSPHVLLSDTEADEEDYRTAQLASVIDAALFAADESEQSQATSSPDMALPSRSAASASLPPCKDTFTGGAALPAPDVHVVQVPTSRKHSPGLSTMGISALTMPICLASIEAKDVIALVDSGADISLISQECLEAIPERARPRLHRGLRMKLFQLTNRFFIDGFVRLPIFVEADNGDWLLMEVECYVVPNMTTPILLGEDFQVNYELGVTRRIASSSSLFIPTTGHSISASSSSSPRQRQKTKHSPLNTTAVAAVDATIRPHSCKRIPLANSLPAGTAWFVEKTVLGQADGACLLSTPTLIDAEHCWIAVSNPTDRPQCVCRGEALGPLHSAEGWF
ncbi:hypothetical protein FOMPIDRAFT_56857, partial [Fomitopsis schrenkii]